MSNLVDESILTVSSTSIGLSSADPTLAAAELLGARQAVITVKTAPVYYHQDGGAATSSDPILYPNDILPVLGHGMHTIFTKLRFLRVGATDATLHIRWFDRDTFNVAPVIRGLPVGAETGAVKTEKAWLFGKPTLQWLKNNGTESNGRAKWVKEWDRYGEWTAKLSPGIQSLGDDYASVSFVVNNMPLTDLASINWVYRMGATEVAAPNVAIHVHDPDIVDARADITLSHSHDDLGKTSGWQHFELLPATDGLFWYGDADIIAESGTTGLTGNNGTSLYTLAEFQADAVFSTYVIDKITIEYGYYTTGHFSPAHICKVSVNDIDIPLVPSIEEQLDIARDDQAKALTTIPTWTFGEPTLRASVNGQATWSRWHHQRPGTGWSAQLYGGKQDVYNDWARVMIPVNEMPIGDLKSLMYSWNNTEEEAEGPHLAIYIHDPDDNDARVEMTYLGVQVDKEAGWQAFELDVTADYFYWYGENGSSTIGEGPGTQRGLDDYQADATFGRWTIYRIDVVWGGATGDAVYENLWLLDVKVNGTVIPMKPDSSGTGRIGKKFYTAGTSIASGAAVLAPKTPYRLLSVSMKLNEEQTGGSAFVLSLLSEQGTAYDPAILTDDMDVPAGRLSLYAPFGQGYEFGMDDEIDLVYTNTGTKTYGLTYTYEVLCD